MAAFKEREEKSRERILQSHLERHDKPYNPEKLTEEERARREDKIIDQFSKVVVIKILTKGDINFMGSIDSKLIAEVTFKLMDFKSCWLTRIREGVITIKIYEDRITF